MHLGLVGDGGLVVLVELLPADVFRGVEEGAAEAEEGDADAAVHDAMKSDFVLEERESLGAEDGAEFPEGGGEAVTGGLDGGGEEFTGNDERGRVRAEIGEKESETIEGHFDFCTTYIDVKYNTD